MDTFTDLTETKKMPVWFGIKNDGENNQNLIVNVDVEHLYLQQQQS